MTALFWTCLLGGLVLAVVAVFAADVLDGALDGLLSGMHDAFGVLASIVGVAAFGGAGLLLDAYTALEPAAVVTGAASGGVALALAAHYGYVRPMRRAENSTGFSDREYAGRLGEVNTAIPARGYGEVLVRMGHATTFQPAASFDGTPLAPGTRVVVVEVERGGGLRVAPFVEGETPAPEGGWQLGEEPSRRRLRS